MHREVEQQARETNSILNCDNVTCLETGELMHLAVRNKSKYNNVDNVMMLRVYSADTVV